MKLQSFAISFIVLFTTNCLGQVADKKFAKPTLYTAAEIEAKVSALFDAQENKAQNLLGLEIKQEDWNALVKAKPTDGELEKLQKDYCQSALLEVAVMQQRYLQGADSIDMLKVSVVALYRGLLAIDGDRSLRLRILESLSKQLKDLEAYQMVRLNRGGGMEHEFYAARRLRLELDIVVTKEKAAMETTR